MTANQPLGMLFSLGRMAYALSVEVSKFRKMSTHSSLLPSNAETIAELRELYREAQARATRLRLLHATGQDLAAANANTLSATLQSCADRIAFFVGCRSARIDLGGKAKGIPIRAPGEDQEANASIVINGLDALAEIPDQEDRDTAHMLLDMIGATIDRIDRERENLHLLDELRDREKRLETLLDRIFTAQEEERRRVSHELHDGVAQTATALVRLLESAEQSQAATVQNSISHADVARGLVSELRRVIAGLRPTSLDDLGLVPALRSLIEGLETEGFTVTQKLGAENTRLPHLVENALYRVAQEAIANIHKHAGGPCDVIIEAQLADASSTRFLRIVDFGSGPSAANAETASHSGYNVGIEVMKERMTAIGGHLFWNAGSEKGVVVEARLPTPN